MQGANDPFVHVFLFQCGGCGAPVSTASASGARNLEQMDARSFSLSCNACGWSGKSTGTAAKRHWVDFWESEDGNAGADGHDGRNRIGEPRNAGKPL
jgi:hypothetical protein